jgi:hypothetical protein
MHIEIEDALCKCIEEIRVVRDDDDGLFVLDEEFGEMRDAFFVQIVGRLVEEEQVSADASRSRACWPPENVLITLS